MLLSDSADPGRPFLNGSPDPGVGRSFEGIVTPEAVVLEFETAGIGSRSAAAGVDLTIRYVGATVLIIAGFVLDAAATVLPNWIAVTFITFVVFFFVVAYPAVFESIWRGKTPGKAIFGLKVVTTEGAPIGFRHAAIRAGLAIFEEVITGGVVAAFVMFFSSRGQRLGDMVAGTLVLRERHAQRAPEAMVFQTPPFAGEFMSMLDVSALTSDEYIAIRGFLVRAPDLRGAARQELGDQLARRFADRLSSSPPNWMTAELFLVCVASAYQRRFSAPI